MGTDQSEFSGLSANSDPINGSPYGLDIEQWRIERQWINAECTHSGTFGAVTRRLVAYDWQFQCALPVDQDNFPDDLFFFSPSQDDAEYVNVNLAIAFYLGDVKTNPEAQAMNMQQSYYYSPACIIRSIQPVLNAARDVIRYELSGEGNSRLFLLPSEQEDCQKYTQYLQGRGWLT
jgi:hypothetical protein